MLLLPLLLLHSSGLDEARRLLGLFHHGLGLGVPGRIGKDDLHRAIQEGEEMLHSQGAR